MKKTFKQLSAHDQSWVINTLTTDKDLQSACGLNNISEDINPDNYLSFSVDNNGKLTMMPYAEAKPHPILDNIVKSIFPNL